MRELVHRRAWLALGRLGIVLAIVLSLAPLPASPIAIEQGDKLGHVAAYLALTLWYAQLVATPRELAWRALAFTLMGIALEGLQSLTGWRHGNDPLDALANLAGTAGGFVLGLTPARGLLRAFERRIAQRRGPR